jgi:Polysaccharide lyase
MRSFRAVAVAATILVAAFVRPAGAEVLFRGDLETGDLSQWDYLLKEEGLSVVTDPVAQGKYAAKVTITKNELWTNGLNRVEVQHQPDDAYLTEGKDIYYGFSFYLPQTLTPDNHQILYFETKETYEQVMQLAVEGEHMRFATQKPAWKVHWEADGKATAGKWHRVAIHVKWAASADAGQVDLWFDGEQVVTAGKAQTFLGKPAFVQHGILRDTIDQVETLYFDDARAGTTLDDVLGGAAPSGGSGGAGGAGGGSSGAGGAGSSTGGSFTGGSLTGGSSGSEVGGSASPPGGAGVGGNATAGTPPAAAGASPTMMSTTEDSSCAFTSTGRGGAFSLTALATVSWLLRRRRRSSAAEL